jgi:pimeloyl-ACP methyl ester carboxylesterase
VEQTIFKRLKEMGIGFETRSDTFSGSLPILVMIHGAGGQSQVWQNQTRFLKDSVNAVGLDLPGHGHTRAAKMPNIETYAEWLGNTLKDLFERPVFLMGHSFGGAVVQQTALLYPDLLHGIILVGTGPRLQVAPVFLEGLLNDFEKTVDSIIEFAYASEADVSMVKEGAKLMKTAGAEVVHGDFLACNLFDLRNEVDKIRTPCLIICGDQDKLTPVSLSESLKKLIKGSRFEIVPSAGHMVMIEKYKVLNNYVTGFIKTVIKNVNQCQNEN